MVAKATYLTRRCEDTHDYIWVWVMRFVSNVGLIQKSKYSFSFFSTLPNRVQVDNNFYI